MTTLEDLCYEYRTSKPSDECIAKLVSYASSGEDVVLGLAQVAVRRDFSRKEGPKILLPCHKGKGLDITKAFALYSHASTYKVDVYLCGDGRAEILR
jgi:hypothetical protein